jgi:hypothetical protein
MFAAHLSVPHNPQTANILGLKRWLSAINTNQPEANFFALTANIAHHSHKRLPRFSINNT